MDRDPLSDARDPTILFEEYLRALDAGESPDVNELCARAGTREPELKKRIEIFRTLQELSDTLDSPSANGTPAPVEIERIGRFERLVRIGQGGLSQVFLAHDPALKRSVALKILTPDHIATSDSRSWIASEAQSLACLDHPGVVRVFEIGEADGYAFIAMEFLPGPSLASVLERMRSGDLDERDTVADAARALSTIESRCQLVLRLARALAYCHERGVVHRDIKPGNVLLQADGEPKLIDFGLAHLESDEASLTQVTQRLMGTPAYIAPEQVDGGRTGASPLSDQFSLGIVLYELITTKNPFQRPARAATLDAISRAAPPRPRSLDASIPIDVERICLHALERAPAERYASMSAMADDFEAFLGHRPISLRAPTPARRFALWSRRHRREIALTAKSLGAALFVALAAWIFVGLRDRSQLEGRLAELDASRDELVDPQHFVDRFRALDGLRERARELDGGLLAGVLGAATSSSARSVSERTSLRMSQVLHESWRDLDAAKSMDATASSRKLLEHWSGALDAEASACPESEHNRRDRDRGRVDLPATSAGDAMCLWQYESGPTPLTPTLRPIGLERARTPGLYRVQVREANGRLSLEGEFVVAPELDRRALELRPLHPGIAGRMVDVGRKTLFVQGAGDVDVAAHRIMRDPVRWSDLPLAGWPAKRCDDAKASAEYLARRAFDANDPATLEWDLAVEFASALGARLAAGCELAVALRDANVEFPGRGTDFVGELCSAAIVDDGIFTFRYEGQSPHHKLRYPFIEGHKSERPRFLTFRLALSAAE